jgi:hypothetical protein
LSSISPKIPPRTLGANVRSNTPPIPPAPSHVASSVTCEPSAEVATVQRDYRLSVEETPSGLSERDQLSSYVSRWTVAPSGDGSEVTLEATWDGAGGIGGVFERTFAPRVLGGIFGEMLDKLAAAVSA